MRFGVYLGHKHKEPQGTYVHGGGTHVCTYIPTYLPNYLAIPSKVLSTYIHVLRLTYGHTILTYIRTPLGFLLILGLCSLGFGVWGLGVWGLGFRG